MNNNVIDLLSDSEEENQPPAVLNRQNNPAGALKSHQNKQKEIICIDLLDEDDGDEDEANFQTDLSRAIRASLGNDDVPNYVTNSEKSTDNEDDRKQPARTDLDRDKKRIKTDSPARTDATEAALFPDVVIQQPPAALVPAVASLPSNDSGEDEEIAFVGSVGKNALADFPHSREHCVSFPLNKPGIDPSQHCSNCYCYVCDLEASKCKSWTQHCRATHKDVRWRNERERIKHNGGANNVAVPAAAVARVQATVVSQQTVPSYENRPTPGEYSVRALLDLVTKVHPIEITPPPVFVTPLRHYQRQCLAFMQNVEQSSTLLGKVHAFNDIRGGWLASEVGMGKSAVVIALAATNKSDVNPTWRELHKQALKLKGSRKNLKTTVVLTSVSLLGQWEDECEKHAPGLVAKRFHPPSRSRKQARNIDLRVRSAHTLSDLAQTDIIISSATFKWPEWIVDSFEFHRVVMDESHLLGTVSARNHCANFIRSRRKWCVTATPATSSLQDLWDQANFLGLTRQASKFWDVLKHCDAAMDGHRLSGVERNSAFYHFAALLSQIMVRHTKSQRISGSAALALPPSTTRVVQLTMSTKESQYYNMARKGIARTSLHDMRSRGSKVFYFQNTVVNRLSTSNMREISALESVKVQALVNDLGNLRRVDPHMKAVVFTAFKHMHYKCAEASRRHGLQVFEFSGSTNPAQRDKAIRTFQSQSGPPAVFVVTLRAGSVGMTLTAASRVYLMEPSIDPATEVQAAGRIHRLGQTKQVQVVKFAFKSTFEENILELHKEIVAGRISVRNEFLPRAAIHLLLQGL